MPEVSIKPWDDQPTEVIEPPRLKFGNGAFQSYVRVGLKKGEGLK